MNSPAAVHVRPTRDGLWQICVNESRRAASQHLTATEARRSAAELATDFHVTEVFLHDAYHRCRSVQAAELH